MAQSLDTPTLPFLRKFQWAFVRMDLRMYLPILKSVALLIPKIIGRIQKNFGQSLAIKHSLFPKILGLQAFHTDYCSMCSRFPAILDCSFGWSSEPPIKGGGVPSERALVSSYRPSIVTFPISFRVSEILPILFSSMPLFLSHLQSPQNFPMFPWEQVDRLLAKVLG